MQIYKCFFLQRINSFLDYKLSFLTWLWTNSFLYWLSFEFSWPIITSSLFWIFAFFENYKPIETWIPYRALYREKLLSLNTKAKFIRYILKFNFICPHASFQNLVKNYRSSCMVSVQGYFNITISSYLAK